MVSKLVNKKQAERKFRTPQAVGHFRTARGSGAQAFSIMEENVGGVLGPKLISAHIGLPVCAGECQSVGRSQSVC